MRLFADGQSISLSIRQHDLYGFKGRVVHIVLNMNVIISCVMIREEHYFSAEIDLTLELHLEEKDYCFSA